MILSTQSRSGSVLLGGRPNQIRNLWQLYLGRGLQQQLRVYCALTVNNEHVTYLRNGETGAELYLLGTAHVSARSAEEVRELIHQVKPNKVAVELCPERARKLMAGEDSQTKNLLREFLSFPGGLGEKLVHIAVKSVYKILRNTGVEPGKEFKLEHVEHTDDFEPLWDDRRNTWVVALEEAQRLGAELAYIDQDFRVTIMRIAEVITYQDVFKLMTRQASGMPAELLREFEKGDFTEGVEMLKTRENVRVLMKGMEEIFPNVVKVLIHERDELMVKNLRQCKGTVVGVVGMAHLDGIERLWKQYEK